MNRKNLSRFFIVLAILFIGIFHSQLKAKGYTDVDIENWLIGDYILVKSISSDPKNILNPPNYQRISFHRNRTCTLTTKNGLKGETKYSIIVNGFKIRLNAPYKLGLGYINVKFHNNNNKVIDILFLGNESGGLHWGKIFARE